ncbi:twin-arginine translocase TatA/TatE family subunit [Enterovirga rhinocerotis]|uniref:Sec-independent protein translocase protein TatA n=1 Tax=Enterovirga rhinocerotis TaxID=1339210 RepID=A0A4R7C4U1_9HYPH|nr:twin-arginine translocase TatA/TatE family subunit [Enterovirga rhinocerotis]TDR93570.1 sec-independent protein translocase protein TatA [Enterovirga rhinocerotis]
MGGVSIWHWVVVGVVVMLLFGRGKISELMGDMAKGIKEFKKGMADEPAASQQPPAAPEASRPLEHRQDGTADVATPASSLADRKLG